MRLWSLHPRYLDTQGLLALWREGLLAQKVLAGKTRGYRHHPQLERFKAHPAPEKAIGRYLLEVWKEARRRGYAFQKNKVKNAEAKIRRLSVTGGQLRFERAHLAQKLRNRSPQWLKTWEFPIKPHPFLKVIPGPVEFWERAGKPGKSA